MIIGGVKPQHDGVEIVSQCSSRDAGSAETVWGLKL